MNRLRLGLALVWLLFASFAPAHAAVMHHAACDHMSMPHAPMHDAPAHDEAAMPCCSVPVIVATKPFILLSERAAIFVKLRPLPVHRLHGLTPTADPRPPKTSEV